MKLTHEIYNKYKSNADYAFSDMYNSIAKEVQLYNEDIQDDEVNQLTNDIMLSNVLGYVTSFEEVHELLKKSKENKKIRIPLSENDLQELQCGEEFDWTFDGVDVHLYQDDNNEDDEE